MLISFVIRSYGREYVPEILAAIDKQDLQGYKFSEIVIVNGMNSFTWDLPLLSRKCSKIITINIDEHKYKPGKALNIGLSHSQCDVAVFLSGHTIPIGSKWLSQLLGPHRKQSVSCVSGSHFVYPESNVLEKAYRQIWYQKDLIAKVFNHCNFANAAVRRKYWEIIKFNEKVSGCEDRLWARAVKRECGARPVFNKLATAYHSHRCSVAKTVMYLAWLFTESAKCFLFEEK